MMKPEDLAMVVDARELIGFMPYLRAEVLRMHHDVEVKAYAALRDHTLTAEQALSLWREKLAAADLLRRFEVRIKMGQSVAVSHEQTLDRMPK